MTVKRRLLERTLGFFFRELTVARARLVAPRFWRVDLLGAALRGKPWTAGDKVQVLLDDGPRTYSPFAFDGDGGALSLLCYEHGPSPGAQWGKTAREGDKVRLFGPRGSLPLAELGDIVLVGDETSFGLARALRDLGSAAPRHIFEVNEREAAERALAHLELAGSLVERAPSDAHHAELDDRVREALRDRPTATLVLTGKASTIQSLRARLARPPAPIARQRTKAYWAPGKRGLD